MRLNRFFHNLKVLHGRSGGWVGGGWVGGWTGSDYNATCVAPTDQLKLS